MAAVTRMITEPLYAWGAGKTVGVEECTLPVLSAGKHRPWARLVPITDFPEWALRRGDIVVYTDYSGLGGGAMAAVTAGGEVHVAPAPLGRRTNQGEVAAVWHGLESALSRKKTPSRVVLATDSQEALLDLLLRGGSEAIRFGEAQQSLLEEGIEVELWWCKGHSGAPLNSCADAAARARGRGLAGELTGAKMGRLLERIQDRARAVPKQSIMRNCHYPAIYDAESVPLMVQ